MSIVRELIKEMKKEEKASKPKQETFEYISKEEVEKRLREWENEAEEKINEIFDKPTSYWLSQVDPNTGEPYEIPFLVPGMEGYEKEYVRLMKLKELDPEFFQKIINME